MIVMLWDVLVLVNQRFINALLQTVSKSKVELLTTSDQFQTTQDFIKIPLDNKNYIIDTPGIINPNSFGAYLSYESLKIITPKKFLKPKTYQLNCEQTVFLGGLVQIDFLEGEKISLTTYISNDLYIHRTKMINAKELIERHILKLLVPPINLDEKQALDNKKTIEFSFDGAYFDLEISGIGFLHLAGNKVKIAVTVAEQIDVKLVKSFL